VKKESIDLVAKQFDLTAKQAERILREHDGDEQKTLHALMDI